MSIATRIPLLQLLSAETIEAIVTRAINSSNLSNTTVAATLPASQYTYQGREQAQYQKGDISLN
jgi:hypothetical protein